jgi:hypothetical protein
MSGDPNNFKGDPNDRLNLNDWFDNYTELAPNENPRENRPRNQDEQYANVLTRGLLEGIRRGDAELNEDIQRVAQDDDLQIAEPDADMIDGIADGMNELNNTYKYDPRYQDILKRIENFIKQKSGGDMNMVIYSGISLLFGQLKHVFQRQQDLTTANATHLLLTLRAVFATILQQNQAQPAGRQLTTMGIIIQFTRVLWHKLVEFLKNTLLGQWVKKMIFQKMLFTKSNMAKLALATMCAYICWKYWNGNNGAS